MGDNTTRQYRTPDAAAGQIAWQHGFRIPVHVASEIAAAVLAHHDTVITAVQRTHTEVWDSDEHYRDNVRRHLRLDLLDSITSKGMIPTALPTETIRYERFRGVFIESGPVPDWAVAKGDHGDTTIVELRCTARTPPDAGEAVVKAATL